VDKGGAKAEGGTPAPRGVSATAETAQRSNSVEVSAITYTVRRKKKTTGSATAETASNCCKPVGLQKSRFKGLVIIE